MKRFLLLFPFLALSSLWGQTPACQFRGAYTSATAASGTGNTIIPYQNNTANPICNAFVLTWVSTAAMSALSIQIEGADTATGSYTVFTGATTVLVGTNPATTLSGTIAIQASSTLAFIRVHMTSFTGPGGTVNYQVYGYNGVTPLAKSGGCGSLAGDVTGPCGANTVVGVEGAAVPKSAGLLNTNSLGQLGQANPIGVTLANITTLSLMNAISGPFFATTDGSGDTNNGVCAIWAGGGSNKGYLEAGNLTDGVCLMGIGGSFVINSAQTLQSAGTGTITADLVKTAAGATATTNGAIKYDTTGNNLHAGQASADAIVVTTPPATPVNGDCAQWVKAGGKITLGDTGSACGSGGATAFSGLTSGTNTAAAMLVGTGASLGPTGTGTITATQVPTAVGAAATTNGAIIYDTTNNNLHAGQGAADAKVAQYTVTPGNGNCVNWVVSAGKIDLGDAGSACGSGGSGGGGVVTYSGPTLSILSGTSFCPIGGGGSCSATETNVDIDSSAAATVSKMYVQLSQALGVGNSVVVTWRDNAVSQTVTCTISGAVATACNDTTHSFNVAGGDLLDYQLVFSGTIVVTPTITIMSAFGTSNVGVTSVTATGPITSSGGTTPNISATYQGNGAKIQASTGTTTTNDCVKFDANGNTVDAGAACGSGGGGGPSVTTGNYASLPASCTHTSTQSDIYGFTNSPYNQGFCTATNTWSIFYPPWGAVTVPPTSLTGASTTLNGAINNSTTTCVVSADLSPAASVPFLALIDTEIVYVSAKGAGNVNWTCLRGFNTTTAASHLNGATVTLTNWQEINFTNATVDLTQGATLLTSVPDAANSEKALMTAIPVAPFTITALVNPLIFGASTDSHFGVCVAEGTTAKFYSYIMTTDENGNGNVYDAALKKWTNYTTDSAPSANQIVINAGGPPELIIKDVGGGGNITFTIKLSNGITFQSFAETDTTFLTSGAHSAGICTNPREGTTPVGGWLLSWNVTTP